MYQQKRKHLLIYLQHLLRFKDIYYKLYHFTNISLEIFDTTKSTVQLLNFCLREMLKKFIIKCACKTSCGNRCAYKKREYICK